MDENSLEITSKSRLLIAYEKYMMVAGVLGQIYFYIQGLEIFLRKSAHGVSLIGFIIGFLVVSSWEIYGLLMRNRIMIISNIVAMIGALFVIIGILVHR